MQSLLWKTCGKTELATTSSTTQVLSISMTTSSATSANLLPSIVGCCRSQARLTLVVEAWIEAAYCSAEQYSRQSLLEQQHCSSKRKSARMPGNLVYRDHCPFAPNRGSMSRLQEFRTRLCNNFMCGSRGSSVLALRNSEVRDPNKKNTIGQADTDLFDGFEKTLRQSLIFPEFGNWVVARSFDRWPSAGNSFFRSNGPKLLLLRSASAHLA